MPGWKCLLRSLAAGVALLTLAVAQVGANEVATFSVAAGAYGDIRFKALHVQLQGTARTSGGTIRLAELDAGGQQWRDLDIRCGELTLREGRIACRRGRVQAGGVDVALDIEAVQFDTRSGSFTLTAQESRHKTRIAVRGDERQGVQAELGNVSVAALAAYVPALAAWSPDGVVQAKLRLIPAKDGLRAEVQGSVREGRFASGDALQAGENIVLAFKVNARQRGAGWDFSTELDWQTGEVYVHPVYLKDGAQLRLDGRWQGERLNLREAVLQLPGVETRARDVDVRLGDTTQIVHAEIELVDADLAHVGPQFLAPLLVPERADDLVFSGHFGARARVRDGTPIEIDARFTDVGGRLNSAELSFGPIRGTMTWRTGEERNTRLQVAGGRWQQIALGAFDVNLRVGENYVVADDLVVPLLDSHVRLGNLQLVRGENGWSGGAAAVIEPIDMQRLTETFGWPTMHGTLAASMPQVRITPGQIELDGALVVDVFDGTLKVDRLRVAEPFGVGSYLEADVEARHIDLYQLTETFSFGSIEGLIDVDIKALALSDWTPVAFTADLRSAPGRYRRRISQRAVENITALGGAGAVAAIQRTFLGIFDDFGYRDIRVACRLENGVCEMDGIAGADSGAAHFTLIRGGGVPALNVVGYNRRVDWVELVERVQRVIASNASPVIR